MTNMEIAVALFTSPRKAFDAIAAKPRWLFPLVLLLVPTLVVLVWYYAIVDIPWLMDLQMRNSPGAANMTEEQRAQVAQFMTPTAVMLSSVLGGAILILVLRLLEAVWYLLAGKVTNVDRSFPQWFALACWTSLPGVLAVIPAALSLLMADGTQINPGALQPLSLNELVFHREVGARGYTLFSAIGLLQIAGGVLAIIGVQHWSKRSWLFAALFVLLPCILIITPFLISAMRAS